MEYQMTTCTQCGCNLRLPRGKGVLDVTCPKCGNRFRFDSGRSAASDGGRTGSAREQRSQWSQSSPGGGCIVGTRPSPKVGAVIIGIMIVVFVVLLFVLGSSGGLNLSGGSQLYVFIGVCILLALAGMDLYSRASAYIEVRTGEVRGKAIEGTFFARSKDFSVKYADIRNVSGAEKNVVSLFTAFGTYKVPIKDAQRKAQVVEEIQKRIR